jgi:uncharacterized protein with PIN domain
MDEPRAPRFLCDAMVGRLARRLRMLGYDAAYEPATEDRALLRRAAREGRVLLTRDTRIAAAPGGMILVLRANDTGGQLRETVRALGLGAPPGLLTRCIVCNESLRPAQAAEVEAKAPAFVRSGTGEFRACPRCGRVYWPGTHREAMLRRLADELRGP